MFESQKLHRLRLQQTPSCCLQKHQRWPKKSIVLNRGFELLPELKDVLSGVLVESVYQGFDPTTKRYRAVDPQGSEWLEARIHEAQALGLAVYAVTR